MKKTLRAARKRQPAIESFGAFPLIGPFAFASFLDFPNNLLIAITPVLIVEAILVVLFLLRINKKHKLAAQPPAQPGAVTQLAPGVPGELKPQPKAKGIRVAKAEIVNDTVKFSAKKGLLRKHWVTVKEIPLFEITGVESFGNQLTVTWKGTTDAFTNPTKGESFAQLHEQIQSLLDEHKKMLEAQEQAEQTPKRPHHHHKRVVGRGGALV